MNNKLRMNAERNGLKLIPEASAPLGRWNPCAQAPADESGGVTVIWASPLPKTLVIWASPSHTYLAIWVRVTGDAGPYHQWECRYPKQGDTRITVTAAQWPVSRKSR